MDAALEAEGAAPALRLTMIYVTHDQTEALTFADKVVVMYEGEVVQIGTPVELFERPAHTFVGHFIGSPGMNVAARARSTAARRGSAAQAIALPQLRRRRRQAPGSRSAFGRNSSGFGQRRGFPVDDRAGRRCRALPHRATPTSMASRSTRSSAEDAALPATSARRPLRSGAPHLYADGRLVGSERRDLMDKIREQ